MPAEVNSWMELLEHLLKFCPNFDCARDGESKIHFRLWKLWYKRKIKQVTYSSGRKFKKNYLKYIFPNYKGWNFIMSDFEQAIRNPHKQVFRNGATKLCFFHLGQSGYRHMQSVLQSPKNMQPTFRQNFNLPSMWPLQLHLMNSGK